MLKDYAEIEIDASKVTSPKMLCIKLADAVHERGWQSITLKSTTTTSYPNTCAPIAGIIDHYANQGISIKCDWAVDETAYLAHTRAHNPFTVDTEEGKKRLLRPFDVVWKFSDSLEIKQLVDAVLAEVSTCTDVEHGVLTGIEWCLNEVMDNVLQHSEADCGFFMGQYVESSRRLSLCVYDNGIGIYQSLKDSKHSPSTPLDAITLALQERITRDDRIGQGNGMWGLSEIVRANAGRYRISSQGAFVSLLNGSMKHGKYGGFYYGSEGLGTTLVDFQIDCSKHIDVAQTLNHDPSPLWLEELENDEGSEYIIRIAEVSEGTGTRRAAEKVRHLAMNIVREGEKRLVFDFEGVGTTSSSYADELVGKLVAEIGFLAFSNHFRLQHVSPLNQQVINRSVQQRMAQEYYGEPPIDD